MIGMIFLLGLTSTAQAAKEVNYKCVATVLQEQNSAGAQSDFFTLNTNSSGFTAIWKEEFLPFKVISSGKTLSLENSIFKRFGIFAKLVAGKEGSIRLETQAFLMDEASQKTFVIGSVDLPEKGESRQVLKTSTRFQIQDIEGKVLSADANVIVRCELK